MLGKKIGGIISRKRKSNEMGPKPKDVIAMNKTHPCVQNDEQTANGKRRRTAVLASLSGVFAKGAGFSLRKWKRVATKENEAKGSRLMTKIDNMHEEMELCKKRILMGGKCRALNASGVLHYDKQGILLHEDVF